MLSKGLLGFDICEYLGAKLGDLSVNGGSILFEEDIDDVGNKDNATDDITSKKNI